MRSLAGRIFGYAVATSRATADPSALLRGALVALIAAPERTSGNYRAYGEAALARLSYIRRARDLGFPRSSPRLADARERRNERLRIRRRDGPAASRRDRSQDRRPDGVARRAFGTARVLQGRHHRKVPGDRVARATPPVTELEQTSRPIGGHSHELHRLPPPAARSCRRSPVRARPCAGSGSAQEHALIAPTRRSTRSAARAHRRNTRLEPWLWPLPSTSGVPGRLFRYLGVNGGGARDVGTGRRPSCRHRHSGTISS